MTTNTTQRTVRQWLESLAKTDTSVEKDSAMMQNLLRKVGFPNAVVTCGIVYAEGHGTIEFPPISIHSMAGMLVKGGRNGN